MHLLEGKRTSVPLKFTGGEPSMGNKELNRALCRTLIEIAEREKKKAISSDDYGTALVAAIFESIFKEAEAAIPY